MTQPFQNQPQLKVRTALLIFMKSAPQPIVIYTPNPQKDYDDIKNAMKMPNVLVEKEATGPIKKISMMSNSILGVMLQDEQYT